MNTKPTRGGARPGSGRKPTGRRQLTVRIKAEILDALAPDAANTIRELVETKYRSLGAVVKYGRQKEENQCALALDRGQAIIINPKTP